MSNLRRSLGRISRRALLWAALGGVGACAPDSLGVDAGTEMPSIDGSTDGAWLDAADLDGSPADALPDTTALPDSALLDASDSGYPDSGLPDSGYPDSSYPDSGYPDSSYPDSGLPDSPSLPGCDAGTLCGAACIDTTADVRHCGSCDSDCTALAGVDGAAVGCAAGRCVLAGACVSRRADCNGDDSDGCETDLEAVDHCGACATACSGATPVCDASSAEPQCISGCAADEVRCGALCVDLQTSLSDCGACGQACAETSNGHAVCDAGACGLVCDVGHHLCGDACVSDADPAHCGSACGPCTSPVGGTATCDGTSCGFVCASGQHACGDACVSDTGPATCGSACAPCPTDPNGLTSCDGTACSLACNSGYLGAGARCVDVDECAITSGLCGSGTCMNVPGGYTCSCDAGYVASGPGGSCTDLDECAATPAICGSGGAGGSNAMGCTNTTGSYSCSCRAGYASAGTGRGGVCADVDECATPLTCGVAGTGGSNGRGCTNTPGTFQCTCLPNYPPPAPGGTCTTTCGDGYRADREMCDDGNTISNDGCSSTCVVEYGWTCDTAGPSVCSIAWSFDDGSYGFTFGGGEWGLWRWTPGAWTGTGANSATEWILVGPVRVVPPRRSLGGGTPHTATLTVNHSVAFDTFFDGGVVDVRVDGGAWTRVTFAPGGAYTTAIVTSFGSPIGGQEAFSTTATLTSVARIPMNPGQSFQFRFRGVSDRIAGTIATWILDNISVTFL